MPTYSIDQDVKFPSPLEGEGEGGGRSASAEHTDDCPRCGCGRICSAETADEGETTSAHIECADCGLEGPMAASIESARHWWNLLARLARMEVAIDRDTNRARYGLALLPPGIRAPDLPVRNDPPILKDRPHHLDGGRSEPFTVRTVRADDPPPVLDDTGKQGALE